MADFEKVIRGLEHCGFTGKRGCAGCPYSDECGDFGCEAGTGSLCTDALALLREQEPQETVNPDFWISVEERLPEDSVEVLVLLKRKDVLVPDMGALVGGAFWSTLSYNVMVGDPLFWANIPHGPDGYKWYTDVEVDGDAGGEQG